MTNLIDILSGNKQNVDNNKQGVGRAEGGKKRNQKLSKQKIETQNNSVAAGRGFGPGGAFTHVF